MIEYNWMGQHKIARFKSTGEPKKWLLMFDPMSGQSVILGGVEFDKNRDRYVARAKGREFVAMRRVDAAMKLIDFMHDEVKRQTEAYNATKMGWDILD
jgi:hypothetical protein